MAEPREPPDPARLPDLPDDATRDDIIAYLRATRNWGRWGDDDELGALNLVDDAKRRRAAGLVRQGRSIGLSRAVPVQPAANNPRPATMALSRFGSSTTGGSSDTQAMSFHGVAATHIDALCHVWDEDGMWGGRDPDVEIADEGARWGSIDRWRHGLLTRGVLIDVAAHRGRPFVTPDEPVDGRELREIVDRQGVAVEPGDALLIHCGREAYEREHGPWGTGGPFGQRPGLEATCLGFFRETDCAALLWDMFDARPSRYDLVYGVHAAIYAYGVAVVDAALLEPLADACREAGTFEVMLSVAPLRVEGATGGLVNPIATL